MADLMSEQMGLVECVQKLFLDIVELQRDFSPLASNVDIFGNGALESYIYLVSTGQRIR